MAPPPDNPKVSAKNLAPTIISADLRIKGDVIGSGDIQIDGIVEGDVHSRSITVGEGAEVRGSLSADTVRVYGTVAGGTIKATTVTLAKTAKVHSDIIHQTMALEAKEKPPTFMPSPFPPTSFNPAPVPPPAHGPSPIGPSPLRPTPILPTP